MDYLIGEGIHSQFNKKMLKRFQEFGLLKYDKKETLFDLIDTYILDAKTRKTFAE